jgi:hypothetical protein
MKDSVYFKVVVTVLISAVIPIATAVMSVPADQPFTTRSIIVICAGGVLAACHTVQKMLETPPS